MNDCPTIIPAEVAWRLTNKTITSVVGKVNRAIEGAVFRGEFSCSVYLSDTEYQIVEQGLADYKVTKLEQTSSISFHYKLDFSGNRS